MIKELQKATQIICDIIVFIDVFISFCVLVSCASASPYNRALWQFHSLIKCAIPNSAPLAEYNNYGCYCGLGGGGTPKDTLDRCCQTHDNCYSQANALSSCSGILNNPYTKSYSYTCSGTSITCTCKYESLLIDR